MILEVKKNLNRLSILNFNQLESYQIGSIEYIGFIKNEQKLEYFIKSEHISKLLFELIDYLEYENINFRICEECSEILHAHQLLINDFKRIKDIGLNFKNGKFNQLDYNNFQVEINKLIVRPLKNHQKKAAYHLYITSNGANFSVPGSGKTSVVLSVYEKLKSENKVNTLFVVGPLACFGPWKSEFKLVLGRKPKSKVLAGGFRERRKASYFETAETKSELYLTSFQSLLSDTEEVKYLFNQKGINIFLVIDEAHYIKRLDGQWASAVLSLSNLASYRCILTGTPFPKSYVDTFNLFDFLWPSQTVIDADLKMRIKNLENNNDYVSASDIIRNKINPLFYRVRKKELGLKKQVFNAPIIVKMNPLELKVYRAIENRIEDYAKREYANNIGFVSRLCRGRMIRLRQAVSYVGLIKESIMDYEEDLLISLSDIRTTVENYDQLEKPSKINTLLSLIEDLRNKNRKVVVWSNFIGSLKLIERNLLDIGNNCKIIFGGTPIDNEIDKNLLTREQIRNEFMDEKSGLDILIANPAACSESISLHKTCQDAIYYDLSYNCAQYLQSLDRIHRVGGSEYKESRYFYLQYENTIEKDILENIRRKSEKMYDIIEEDFNIYSLDMYENEQDDLEAYKRLFVD